MTSFVAENQAKSKSGKNAKKLIQEMINFMIVKGFRIKLIENYKSGYDGKAKQFKMDFAISFTDFCDELWLIKSTSTIRDDRIYGHEFFAQHIKEIDHDVKKIFIVVPDSIPEKEVRNKDNYAKKVKNKKYVSYIDDVLTVSELERQIIEKASSIIAQGSRANILGSFSEESIMNLLNENKNLTLWNDYIGSQQQTKSSTFLYYKTILEVAGLSEGSDTLIKIIASDKIPRLSNNGAPKTDVYFTVETNNVCISKNISIKNTEKSEVSVHEGNVVDLVFALGIDTDSELSLALQKFESCGSIGGDKGLEVKFPNALMVLEQNLSKYNKPMAEFFLFGVNSPLVTCDTQVADMILFANPFEVWSRDEYIHHYLTKFSNKGQLGTPFKWTYPSGKRGKKIQIKGFTNRK